MNIGQRAGRDSLPSECLCYYSESDFQKARNIIESDFNQNHGQSKSCIIIYRVWTSSTHHAKNAWQDRSGNGLIMFARSIRGTSEDRKRSVLGLLEQMKKLCRHRTCTGFRTFLRTDSVLVVAFFATDRLEGAFVSSCFSTDIFRRSSKVPQAAVHSGLLWGEGQSTLRAV